MRLADFLLPPLCLSCGAGVSQVNTLCADCWKTVHFLEKPYCPVSGLPFAYDPGPDIVSPQALAHPPHYDCARSVFAYEGPAARMIHRYKYGDRMEVAPAFARWMARAGHEILADADLIVPVPLHRRRLFWRRFNQASELARHIGQLAGVTLMPELLLRFRPTQPQIGLSGTARRRNVSGAFRANPVCASGATGKIIVLVDDVLTTGATVEACARVLKGIGAREVRVLTLARVVPDENTPI
ncbi:MAG: ComF family protein [Rhizobiales bacterium]|nr:ComF family protein [Hyphomicrobiales bacterium]